MSASTVFLCLSAFFFLTTLLSWGKGKMRSWDMDSKAARLKEKELGITKLQKELEIKFGSKASKLSELRSLLADTEAHLAKIAREDEDKTEMVTKWCFHSVVGLERQLLDGSEPRACEPHELPEKSRASAGVELTASELQKLLRERDEQLARSSGKKAQATVALAQSGLKIMELEKQLQDAVVDSPHEAKGSASALQLSELQRQCQDKDQRAARLAEELQSKKAALAEREATQLALERQMRQGNTSVACAAELRSNRTPDLPQLLEQLKAKDAVLAQNAEALEWQVMMMRVLLFAIIAVLLYHLCTYLESQ